MECGGANIKMITPKGENDMPTKELGKIFVSIDGKVFEPFNDIKEISIETSSLDMAKSYNFDRNKEFEAKFEIEKKRQKNYTPSYGKNMEKSLQ